MENKIYNYSWLDIMSSQGSMFVFCMQLLQGYVAGHNLVVEFELSFVFKQFSLFCFVWRMNCVLKPQQFLDNGYF